MLETLKSIVRKIVPETMLKNYLGLSYLEWKVKYLEEQFQHRWIAERIGIPMKQKDLLRMKEFKVYSQTGEDGIIDYIFSRIKSTNKKFVEIGVEDGKECNTATLSRHFGWNGLLIEGNSKNAKLAREYYKGFPVKVVSSFVTKENINTILKKNGITGEIDLLSIDIDGNEYWIWNEIFEINPRVVVMEYNSSFGNKPITINYSPNFDRLKAHPSMWYHGASLSALTKLGKSKGYILVGCCSTGFNAFFVRKDIAKGKLKELSAQEAFYPHGGRMQFSIDQQFDEIKNLSYVEIP